MQGANLKRMNAVTDLALATSALVYWLVGISGYLIFRSRTAGEGQGSVHGRAVHFGSLQAMHLLCVPGTISWIRHHTQTACKQLTHS